jgi:hypothetical protein
MRLLFLMFYKKCGGINNSFLLNKFFKSSANQRSFFGLDFFNLKFLLIIEKLELTLQNKTRKIVFNTLIVHINRVGIIRIRT